MNLESLILSLTNWFLFVPNNSTQGTNYSHVLQGNQDLKIERKNRSLRVDAIMTLLEDDSSFQISGFGVRWESSRHFYSTLNSDLWREKNTSHSETREREKNDIVAHLFLSCFPRCNNPPPCLLFSTISHRANLPDGWRKLLLGILQWKAHKPKFDPIGNYPILLGIYLYLRLVIRHSLYRNHYLHPELSLVKFSSYLVFYPVFGIFNS